MSDGTGVLEAEFGGETRRFRVALGELRRIQTACDAGPAEIARRLARCVQVQQAKPKASILEQAALGLGDWRIEDVRAPIVEGLVGGGLSPNEAGALVRRFVDERGFRGLTENAALALSLVVVGQDFPEDDLPGKPKAGAAAKPKRSRADG